MGGDQYTGLSYCTYDVTGRVVLTMSGICAMRALFDGGVSTRFHVVQVALMRVEPVVLVVRHELHLPLHFAFSIFITFYTAMLRYKAALLPSHVAASLP